MSSWLIRSLGIWLMCGWTLALDPSKSIAQYIHDTWSIDDGLPQSVVLCIRQTSDGYLWIGTQEGLARFDGVTFSVFDKSNTPAMTSDFITAMLEDRHGRLWVGTYGGGVVIFDGREFKPLMADRSLISDRVLALCRGPSDQIWIGTEEGLNLFDQGRMTAFTEKDGLTNTWVNALWEDAAGTLWIGSYGGGIYRVKGGVWQQTTRDDGLSSDRVLSFHQDADGPMWIGTEAGLCRWHEGRLTCTAEGDALHSAKVFAICRDRQNNLWVATDFGLTRMGLDASQEATIPGDLTHDEIKTLYEDREGSLWIGTAGGGINRFRDPKVTTFTTREGLSSDEIWSVASDSRGRLWVGSETGQLDVLEADRFSPAQPIPGIGQADIMSILETRDGALWVGTDGRGVFRIEGESVNRFTTGQGLSHDRILCLFEDADARIWVGTYGGGLNRIHGRHITIISTQDGLPSNRINAIAQSANGSLWICTNGGLARIDGDQVKAFTSRDGLPSDIVNCLHEDTHGVLWVGTHGGGICRIADDIFETFSTRDGLFSDAVYKILEDDRGRFWISCNKGIFCIQKPGPESESPMVPTVFGEHDGMRARECNGGYQSCGHRDRSGRLWFPTIEGLVMVEPNRIATNELPPPVHIELLVVDQEAPIRPGNDQTQKVELKPGSKRLEIHYTALSFVVPQRVQFKYKLDGFDEDWVSAKSRRTAFYTNIPPGDYTFRVTACNDDGVWHPAGDQLELSLQPYVYQTRWFLFLCSAVAVLLGLAVFRLRLHQLKIRAQKLHQLVESRTIDLRRKNVELETIDRMVRIINREIDLKSVLDALLTQIVGLFPQAQKSCLWLHDSDGTFTVAAAKGFADKELAGIRLSEAQARDRYSSGGDELVEGIVVVKKFDSLPAKEAFQHMAQPKCMLAMSIEMEELLLGFLVLVNMDETNAFADSDMRQLFRFREHVVSAITKAKNLTGLAEEKEKTEKALMETRRAHQKMDRMARTDPLTKLSNRRDMMDRIAHETTRFDRSGQAFCLILADIDNFKSFNDRFGHACGDSVLVGVARLMESMVRKQDTVSRWGGEEFLLLLPETNLNGGRILAEKIRARFAQERFTHGNHQFSIFLTLGVSEYNQKMAIDTLIKKADQNLYLGKKQGKNCVIA